MYIYLSISLSSMTPCVIFMYIYQNHFRFLDLNVQNIVFFLFFLSTIIIVSFFFFKTRLFPKFADRHVLTTKTIDVICCCMCIKRYGTDNVVTMRFIFDT